MIDEAEDDGIPVLTDVLRLGSGPVAPTRLGDVATAGASIDAGNATTSEAPTDALVIGNEPAEESDPLAPDLAVEHVLSSDVVDETADSDDAVVPHHAANAEADVDDGPVEEHVPDDVAPTTVSEGELVDASKPSVLNDEAFAVKLREALLVDLSARIDTELDARLAQAVRAELENALGGLQVQLREHLGEALRDVVRRAVDDELARLRATSGG